MKAKLLTFGSIFALVMSAELIIAGGMLLHDVSVDIINDLAAKSRAKKTLKTGVQSDEDE